MDAQAYLIRQGWSGPGNPLNPNRRPGPHGGLGLTRPLLISRKENKTGVGQKSTKDPTNQWWLRGFEEALRGVGTDGGATPSENLESDSLIRNGSELYKFFVRGEALPGTLDAAKQSGSVSSTVVVSTESQVSILTHKMKSKKGKKDKERRKDRKRKREEEDDDDDEVVSMSQRKKDKKQKKRKSKESDDAENTEDTDERKATKKSKKSRKSKRNDDVESDEQHSKQSPIDEQNVSELQRDKDRNKQKDKKKDKGPDDKKEKKRRKKSRVLAIEEDYPTPASLSPKEDSIMSVVAVKKKTKKKERKEKSSKAKKQKTSTNKDSVT